MNIIVVVELAWPDPGLVKNEKNQKDDRESSDYDGCIILGGGFLLTHGFSSFMVMALPLVISHLFPASG
ncbi:MAG: hypothetical protein P8164_12115 [Gammaproteobacteria bacterium]|jgi:hypothetical protein